MLAPDQKVVGATALVQLVLMEFEEFEEDGRRIDVSESWVDPS
jgi:hypothetical protein